MSKQQQIEQLRAEILRQNVCPELSAQATQLVMGEGNLDADIVLIGEAPGKNEDQQGVPFVGAAGKFLNEMLASAGMERSDIYITNIVKYRPPNNRDPSPKEKAAFWLYVLQELEIIDPKVIVTLGRHSGGYVIPDLQISIDHGNPRKMTIHGKKRLVMPLYHPAAALYNGGMRATLVDDFVRIPEIIAKTNKTKTPPNSGIFVGARLLTWASLCSVSIPFSDIVCCIVSRRKSKCGICYNE